MCHNEDRNAVSLADILTLTVSGPVPFQQGTLCAEVLLNTIQGSGTELISILKALAD